ncbi:hypothetical protein AAC387_Pa10g1852 [Persea americana]
MSNEGGSSSQRGRIHILQPNRDLESNWAVDLAKNLEDYLLKICSGEISSVDDDGHHSVNFAEAALLIQGSIQVYSRKVEYLYSLVLHALEFISQKRQDQQEKTSVDPDGSDACGVVDEENENFLGLDDVPVETKNCLDGRFSRDDALNNLVKPPANLLILEGDCLDTSGDAGELESYLLATTDLFRDFLLLDACDAGSIDKFLEGNDSGVKHNVAQRTDSARSKSRKSYLQSPTRRSGGTAQKSNLGKNQDDSRTPGINCGFGVNDNIHEPDFAHNNPENVYPNEVELDGGVFNLGDDSDDDDDPWKPLNPHEPGALKVKPFKKGKICGRQQRSSTVVNSAAVQFPIAKLDRSISPEFEEALEAQLHAHEKLRASQSPPLYEKLRRSLVSGESQVCNVFYDPMDEDLDNERENDFENFEQGGLQHDSYMDTEVPLPGEKQSDNNVNVDSNEDFGQDGPNSQTSLEDLCRSHLDALLANIAKTEKQEELAARVSTWKQRIEHTLEDQDMRPPFDIHVYGERVLDKLSSDADSGGCMSFADVVSGQTKHDVARTFSALLQLVNNGDVDLDRGDSRAESVCYTAENPFFIRLLRQGKRQEMQLRTSKKRIKSPLRKGHLKDQENRPPPGEKPRLISSSSVLTSPGKSSHSNGKFSVKIGKGNVLRCTPEGKRRRRSRLVIEPVDLQSAG